MTTLTTTPEKSSSISYNPDQVVEALIRSRDEVRKMKRNLIVGDDTSGPMLLITTLGLCFERALVGVPTRTEDLRRMLTFFFGPPQEG